MYTYNSSGLSHVVNTCIPYIVYYSEQLSLYSV